MRGAEELVQAGRHPLDRTPKLPGGVHDGDILRVEAAFHAEAAADVSHNDPDALRRKIECLAQSVAGGGRHLAGQAQGDAAAVPVEAGESGARFHRRGNQALVFQIQ